MDIMIKNIPIPRKAKPDKLILVWGKDRDPYYVWHTGNHELAHYLDFEQIHASDSVRYREIFNKTNTSVSLYATTSPAEDFDDTFKEDMVFCFNLSRIPEPTRLFRMRGGLKED